MIVLAWIITGLLAAAVGVTTGRVLADPADARRWRAAVAVLLTAVGMLVAVLSQ